MYSGTVIVSAAAQHVTMEFQCQCVPLHQEKSVTTHWVVPWSVVVSVQRVIATLPVLTLQAVGARVVDGMGMRLSCKQRGLPKIMCRQLSLISNTVIICTTCDEYELHGCHEGMDNVCCANTLSTSAFIIIIPANISCVFGRGCRPNQFSRGDVVCTTCSRSSQGTGVPQLRWQIPHSNKYDLSVTHLSSPSNRLPPTIPVRVHTWECCDSWHKLLW